MLNPKKYCPLHNKDTAKIQLSEQKAKLVLAFSSVSILFKDTIKQSKRKKIAGNILVFIKKSNRIT